MQLNFQKPLSPKGSSEQATCPCLPGSFTFLASLLNQQATGSPGAPGTSDLLDPSSRAAQGCKCEALRRSIQAGSVLFPVPRTPPEAGGPRILSRGSWAGRCSVHSHPRLLGRRGRRRLEPPAQGGTCRWEPLESVSTVVVSVSRQ